MKVQESILKYCELDQSDIAGNRIMFKRHRLNALLKEIYERGLVDGENVGRIVEAAAQGKSEPAYLLRTKEIELALDLLNSHTDVQEGGDE